MEKFSPWRASKMFGSQFNGRLRKVGGFTAGKGGIRAAQTNRRLAS